MTNQMLSPVVRIVDDDASVCESQSFFLQLAGFRTRSFSTSTSSVFLLPTQR